jgi:hypothetical protein
MSRLPSFASKVFAIDSVIAVQIIGDTTGTEATVCVGRGQRQTKEQFQVHRQL